jgi:GH18 family chitinase
MLAFRPDTIPKIMKSIDFLNIMTYDLMNRRDNVTKHHTGVQNSLKSINAYLERGVPAEKANLGLAFYVKWYKTANDGGCKTVPIGCKTELMENPSTGADLGKAGAFSWHDDVPIELLESFLEALKYGVYDEVGGGHYYWDQEENLFWSWETPNAIRKKLPAVVGTMKLGGVFAWGLGEDAPEFVHLTAANSALKAISSPGNGAHEERSEL